MDRANHALAMHLALLGNEVHLVGYRADADLIDLPNVIFHRVCKIAASYLLSAPLLDRMGRLWARKLESRSVRVIVNGGNCQANDINWVHYLHAAYMPAPAGSLARRVKGALHYRHSLAGERRALNKARVIIANSERTKRDIVERLHIDPSKIRVVYLAADVARFQPVDAPARSALRQNLGWPNDRPIVTFVGAMSDRRKGFDTLFNAWEALCADPQWDADLAVIGAGQALGYWQDRAKTSSLSDRIHFLGFRNDIQNMLAASDIIVSPTRYEAYGLGVHEAFCCGIPAIVSAQAGVAEIVPETLADLMLLADPDDATELRTKLLHWRSTREDYRASVAEFCDSVRKRTWEQCCAEMVDAIQAFDLAGPARTARGSTPGPANLLHDGASFQRSA